MTQEQQGSKGPEAQKPAEATDAVNVVNDTMSQFLSAANVDAVYGEPLHEGNTTIIPCAEILSVAGFGVGYGSGGQAQGDQGAQGAQGQQSGSGGGGGGGGRVLSRPVAVVEITPDGVNVKPIVDVTKLAIAGITTWGFMLTLALRMTRGRRRMRQE